MDFTTTTGRNKQSVSFEEARLGAESAMLSSWPHNSANTTPTLGPDKFPQWFSPPYAFVFYILFEMFGVALFIFIFGLAFYKFAGAVIWMVFARSLIIAGGAYFITLYWCKWTGATLDLPNLWLTAVSEMFFSRQNSATTAAGWVAKLSVLGKGLGFTIAQFIGALVGVAMITTVTGMPVNSSDCSVDIALSCFVKPVVTGVSSSEGRWTAVVSSLLVMAAYFIALGVHKPMSLWVALISKHFVPHNVVESNHQSPPEGVSDEYVSLDIQSHDHKHALESHVHASNTKYVPWQINDNWGDVAKGAAAAHFLVNMLFSDVIGGGYYWWFWFVTSIYSGDFSGASDFAWTGLVSGLIIFVFQLCHFLMATGSANYRSRTLTTLQNTKTL
jgi:hypothetical protein